MCYYNGVKIVKADSIRIKQLEQTIAGIDFLNRPVQSGFDYPLFPVLKPNAAKNHFEITQMEWGFIPHYIKIREELFSFRNGGTDPGTGKFKPPIITLNAIGEEVFDKVTFKHAAQHNRCLVLSSGFFEWRHLFPIGKKTGKPLKTAVKYPYHIFLPEREYFFMAGIFSSWADKQTGELVESFAILTTKANALMYQIHNSKMRMPVILNEDLAWEWIFGNLSQERISEIAVTQFPASQMAAYPLAKDFLSSANPFEEVNYPDVPELET